MVHSSLLILYSWCSSWTDCDLFLQMLSYRKYIQTSESLSLSLSLILSLFLSVLVYWQKRWMKKLDSSNSDLVLFIMQQLFSFVFLSVSGNMPNEDEEVIDFFTSSFSSILLLNNNNKNNKKKNQKPSTSFDPHKISCVFFSTGFSCKIVLLKFC